MPKHTTALVQVADIVVQGFGNSESKFMEVECTSGSSEISMLRRGGGERKFRYVNIYSQWKMIWSILIGGISSDKSMVVLVTV